MQKAMFFLSLVQLQRGHRRGAQPPPGSRNQLRCGAGGVAWGVCVVTLLPWPEQRRRGMEKNPFLVGSGFDPAASEVGPHSGLRSGTLRQLVIDLEEKLCEGSV